MTAIKKWIGAHPNLWEFVLFNLLSNCATITNFVVMWLCTGFIFTPLSDQPFDFSSFTTPMWQMTWACAVFSASWWPPPPPRR